MKKCVNFSQCIEGISLEFEAMAFEKEVKIARTIGCTEFLCSAGSQFCSRNERTYVHLSCDRQDSNCPEYLKQNNSFGEIWLILRR